MHMQSHDQSPDDASTVNDADERCARMTLLEKTEAAERRFQTGEGVPHDDARKQMQAWLK
jgi:hypothetical protein